MGLTNSTQAAVHNSAPKIDVFQVDLPCSVPRVRVRRQRDLCIAAGYSFSLQDTVGSEIAFAAVVQLVQTVPAGNMRCVPGSRDVVTVPTASAGFRAARRAGEGVEKAGPGADASPGRPRPACCHCNVAGNYQGLHESAQRTQYVEPRHSPSMSLASVGAMAGCVVPDLGTATPDTSKNGTMGRTLREDHAPAQTVHNLSACGPVRNPKTSLITLFFHVLVLKLPPPDT
ncbi:hypothetical protein VTK73DRAFT_9074 [Phialemonium thermophilum]|uniref:Uncharacterized protein n=1 Tax=Phialemonium thermophilum TaxID=223376 RepID=A0ABR3W4L9_9PEZI